MSNEAQCAHLTISWRTKEIPYEGPTIPGSGIHVPLKPGTMITQGWWECDFDCGTKFMPVPPLAPKDLNTLVAERIRREHVIGYQFNSLLATFECSCKARWNLGTPITPERIRESMASHHISVGLKPSEVL